MASTPDDPFKAAIASLRLAVEAEKRMKAGDATGKPEAVRLYQAAQKLLDQALTRGGYPAKVVEIMEQKSIHVQKHLTKLSPGTTTKPALKSPGQRASGTKAKTQGPPPMSQRGSGRPATEGKKGPPPTGVSPAVGGKNASSSDPIKQAMALLKAASAEDERIRGGDWSNAAEALRLYNETLACLEVIAASESVSAKMKQTFGKKAH
eukprot:COSAG02_NODE_21917_length_770_cov_1.064083_1_plen_206_part_10